MNRKIARPLCAALAMQSTLAFAEMVDPYPNISCDTAVHDSQESWYNARETNPNQWNYKVTQKLKYCQSINQTPPTDPAPGLSCTSALEQSQENWYDPTTTNPSNWSFKITQKLHYCAGSGTSTPVTSASMCGKWQPGNYFRVFQDSYRDKDAGKDVSEILSTLKQEKAQSYFNGFVLNVLWGEVEKSKGVYNFSVIDGVLNQIASNPDTQHMKLLIMADDRTFHNGCGSGFVPSYVKTEQGTLARKCFAKTWESTGAGQYEAFASTLLKHYQNNPRVLGLIVSGESAIDTPTAKTNSAFYTGVFDRYKTTAKKLSASYPNMILSFGINWPNDRNKYFEPLAKVLDGTSNGSLTWPDTVPPASAYKSTDKQWNSGLKTHREHYETAKAHSKSFAIIAGIETPFILSTKVESERIYRYLSDDVGAQFLVWEPWYYNSDVKNDARYYDSTTYGKNYLKNSVIPTVKAHKGMIKNASCPY